MTITTNGHAALDELISAPEPAAPDWMNATAIAIVGQRNSGKTCLSFSLLEKMRETRPVHIFAHPKPELVTSLGFKHFRRLEELYDMDNCVCYIDEGQLTIPTANKRQNEGLNKLLSVARHRDISLVTSTCDSRWITRSLEAFVDVFLLKDIEVKLLKQGSILHKVVKQFVVVDPEQFRLRKEQFLFYGRDYPEMDGLHTFSPPSFWSPELSKPYSIDRTALDFAPGLRGNCAES